MYEIGSAFVAGFIAGWFYKWLVWDNRKTKELDVISKKTFEEVVALDKQYKKELEK